MSAPTDRPLRCRCGSAEVSLTEVTMEHHRWDEGLWVVDGEIRPVGRALNTTGDIVVEKTRIDCGTCGRSWRPRRPVGMPHNPGEARQ